MKKELERLISELADKELTLGCVVEMGGLKHTIYGKDTEGKGGYSTCYIHKDSGWLSVDIGDDVIKKLKILGKPILIGTVLAETCTAASGIERDERWLKIIKLWMACGFTKSFQSIISDSGWEKYEIMGGHNATGVFTNVMGDRLKNPQAQALALFILKLFPNPSKK